VRFLLQNHREAGRHEITAVIHAPDSDTVLALVSFELRLFVGYDKLCSETHLLTVLDSLWNNFHIFLAKRKEDRLYTYYITLRRFRIIIDAMEKQYVLHTLSLCL
jgi:hypothetical protein